MTFQIEPFKPSFGYHNPHVQTLMGRLRSHMKSVTFRRTRLDTPDGDFIDLDFADVDEATWEQLGDNVPIVLVLHGLEGSAKRGYMFETYRQLAQRGLRPVGMNYRSCSGEMNRTNHFYHSGATEDLAFVHDYLEQTFPNINKGMIGFSLGGNLLLKYLGENGSDLPKTFKGAVSVSPPFDLYKSSQQLERGLARGYNIFLTRALLQKVKLKEKELRPVIDYEKAVRSKNLRAFDDHVTAPLHGFEDSLDYYHESQFGTICSRASPCPNLNFTFIR